MARISRRLGDEVTPSLVLPPYFLSYLPQDLFCLWTPLLPASWGSQPCHCVAWPRATAVPSPSLSLLTVKWRPQHQLPRGSREEGDKLARLGSELSCL